MNETCNIEICLTPSSHRPYEDVRKSLKFDAYSIREAMCPIDIPTNSSSNMIVRMNMSTKRENEILEMRNDIAHMISREIANVLLDYFEKNDTIDGYSKKEFYNLED